MSVWNDIANQLEHQATARPDLIPPISKYEGLLAPRIDVDPSIRQRLAQTAQPQATFAGRTTSSQLDPAKLFAEPASEPIDPDFGTVPMLPAIIVPPGRSTLGVGARAGKDVLRGRAEKKLVKDLVRGAQMVPEELGGGTGSESLLGILRSSRTTPTEFVPLESFEFPGMPANLGANRPGPVNRVLIPKATQKGLAVLKQGPVPLLRVARSGPGTYFHEGMHTTMENVQPAASSPQQLIALRDQINAMLPRPFKVDYTLSAYANLPLVEQVREGVIRLIEASGEMEKRKILPPEYKKAVGTIWEQIKKSLVP